MIIGKGQIYKDKNDEIWIILSDEKQSDLKNKFGWYCGQIEMTEITYKESKTTNEIYDNMTLIDDFYELRRIFSCES